MQGRAATKAKKNSSGDAETLGNIFEQLDVEEPSSEPLGNASNNAKNRPSWKPMDFTLEDDQEQGSFALWCFLEDFYDVRSMIRQTWSEVRSGDITIDVAGEVTEAALGMLHRATDDFIAANPQFPTWASIINYHGFQAHYNGNVVYIIGRDEVDSSVPNSMYPKIPDMLCYPGSSLLPAYREATAIYALNYKGRDGFIGGSIDHVDQPRVATQLEPLLFSMVRELLSLKTYSNKKFRKSPAGLFGLHHETHITSGLLKLTLDTQNVDEKVYLGEPPLWLGMACSILMDIQDQVGSRPRFAGDSLLETANRSLATIAEVCHFHETEDFKAFFSEEKRAALEKMRIRASVTVDIINSSRRLEEDDVPVPEAQQCHKTKSLAPAADTLPHSAGELQYLLKVDLHDHAVIWANEQFAVLILAHLYKAARHYGLVTGTWADMDFVIAQHSTKNKSFITKTGPNADAYSMLRHYLLDLGVEVTAFRNGTVPMCPPDNVIWEKAKRLKPAASGYRAAYVARMKAEEKLGRMRGDVIEVVLAALVEAEQAGSNKQVSCAYPQLPRHTAIWVQRYVQGADSEHMIQT